METSIVINVLAVSLLVMLVALALAVLISVVMVAFDLPKPREKKYHSPLYNRLLLDAYIDLTKELRVELDAIKKQIDELSNK